MGQRSFDRSPFFPPSALWNPSIASALFLSPVQARNGRMLSLLFLCFLRKHGHNSANWLHRSAFSPFCAAVRRIFPWRVLRMQHVCPTCRQSGVPYQDSGLAQCWKRTLDAAIRCCDASRAQAPPLAPPGGMPRLAPDAAGRYDMAGTGRGWTRSAVRCPHSPCRPRRGNRARKRRVGKRYRHPAKRQEKTKLTKLTRRCGGPGGFCRIGAPLGGPPSGTATPSCCVTAPRDTPWRRAKAAPGACERTPAACSDLQCAALPARRTPLAVQPR